MKIFTWFYRRWWRCWWWSLWCSPLCGCPTGACWCTTVSPRCTRAIRSWTCGFLCSL